MPGRALPVHATTHDMWKVIAAWWEYHGCRRRHHVKANPPNKTLQAGVCSRFHPQSGSDCSGSPDGLRVAE
eukprot:6182459-Alexandrium_andersonii.AAC.1